VLFGPAMFNFEAARKLLIDSGAAIQIDDAPQLAEETAVLFGNDLRRHTMGKAGEAAVRANRGALAKLLALLDGQRPSASA